MDNKLWLKSIALFWLCLAGFILFILVLDAKACDYPKPEQIKINVRGI